LVGLFIGVLVGLWMGVNLGQDKPLFAIPEISSQSDAS